MNCICRAANTRTNDAAHAASTRTNTTTTSARRNNKLLADSRFCEKSRFRHRRRETDTHTHTRAHANICGPDSDPRLDAILPGAMCGEKGRPHRRRAVQNLPIHRTPSLGMGTKDFLWRPERMRETEQESERPREREAYAIYACECENTETHGHVSSSKRAHTSGGGCVGWGRYSSPMRNATLFFCVAFERSSERALHM